MDLSVELCPSPSPADAAKLWGEGRLVWMNQFAEGGLDERIYTVGLGGCHAVLARRGERIQLSHYAPTCWQEHGKVLAAFKAERAILWCVPSYTRLGGKWLPYKSTEVQLLSCYCPDTEVRFYSGELMYGKEEFDRFCNAVIYDAGKVTAFNEEVPW